MVTTSMKSAWRPSAAAPVVAPIVGVLTVFRPSLGAVTALVFLASTTLSPSQLAVALLALGFALGAFVGDSSVTEAVASSTGEIVLNPVKVAPFAMVSVGILLACMRTRTRTEPLRSHRLFALYLVVAAIGIWNAPAPSLGILRWIQAAVPLAGAMVWCAYLGPSNRPLFWVLSSAFGLIVGQVALQMTGGGVTYVTTSGVQRFGGWLHPDLASFVAAIVIVVCIFFALPRGAGPILLAGAAAVMAGVVMAGSRGRMGFVALVAMVVTLIFTDRRADTRTAWRKWVLVGAIATICLAAGSELSHWFVRNDATEILSATGRTELWGFSFDLAMENPFVGWGPGQLRGGPLAQRLSAAGFSGHSHNAFLESLVTGGFIGGAFWLAAMGSLLRRVFGTDGEHAGLFRALSVGLLIAGITESGLSGFGFTWFLMLALSVSVAEVEPQRTSLPGESTAAIGANRGVGHS